MRALWQRISRILPLLVIGILFYLLGNGCLSLPRLPLSLIPEIELIPDDTGSELVIYYLDVGQADGALVVCGDHAMLIDGGNASDSRFLYSWLTKTLRLTRLDAVVASHPHEDHIGAIAAALNACRVGTLYSPVTEGPDCPAFPDLIRYAKKQNLSITVPRPGDSFYLGDAKVTFLSPSKSYPDVNDDSVILRVTYGQTSFLFTGDATSVAEDDLLASGRRIRSTVLKVGHHGSNTSSSEAFLRAVSPRYAVISVGADNTYGHPTPETLSRLAAVKAEVLRTDQCGTITCRSDGVNISFETQYVPSETPAPEAAKPDAPAYIPSDTAPYIGNRNTGRFHKASCGSVSDMAAHNRVSFSSREEAVSEGFTPCKRCSP